MAIDLSPERDLSLIFERDDVKTAFAVTCRDGHTDQSQTDRCPHCTQLRLVLAVAISEWVGIVLQSDKYRGALQRIMQVLGPDGVPSDVDYSVPGNLAGLSYEVGEALRIVRDCGIEYQFHRRRS